MEPLLESNTALWPFPFTEQDWQQTPSAVQVYLQTLRHEVSQLHERVESLKRDSTGFHHVLKAASSDSPYKNRAAARAPRLA